MRIRKNLLPLPLVLLLLCSSCSTPRKIAYFQDLGDGVEQRVSNPVTIRLRPNDKISILVNSRDVQLMQLFNLPVMSNSLTASGYGTYAQGMAGYTVSREGDIDFPVLGRIHVAGMTREEVSETVKRELLDRSLVKDPIVTVEYMNLSISVLGEVSRPGRYNITTDKITVLDALSMAGDLTILGRRDNVLVMREVDGRQVSYSVDLCSAGSVYSSPVYYLQQEDIVYVEPNDVRSRQSTVNGNNVRSTSFWVSLASLGLSIATFIKL